MEATRSHDGRSSCPVEAVLPAPQEDDLLHEFSQQTTFHAIPYFASAHHPVGIKVTWLFMFLISFGLCCFTLYPPFISFRDGDLRTSLLLKSKNSLPFPALTICNMNTYRRSMVGSNPQLRGFIMNNLNWSSSEYAFCSSNNGSAKFLTMGEYGGIMNKGSPGLFFIGMDSFQSVIKCTHAGEDCTQNIINVVTDYNLCFTYNPGSSHRSDTLTFMGDSANLSYPSVLGEPLIASNSGPNMALDLVLNAQQFESCDASGPSEMQAGFMLMIHDPEIDPLYMLKGSIRLKPGIKTEIVISQKTFERDTEDLGRCVKHVPLKYFTRDNIYRQDSCFSECLVMLINDTCGCMPIYLPQEPLQEYIARNESVIKILCLFKMGGIKCQNDVEQSNVIDQPIAVSCSQCKTPCDESVYNVEQISAATFPPENMASRYVDKKYADMLHPQPIWSHLVNDSTFQQYQDLYNAKYAMTGNFSSIQEIRQNLLAVKVYFKSMTVEVIREEPLLEVEDLVIQLGGASGLYLGASILSFFELFYWLVLGLMKKHANWRRDRLTNVMQIRKQKKVDPTNDGRHSVLDDL